MESDIVGYSTVEVETGLNLLAVSFNALEGESYALNDFLQGEFVAGERVLFYSEGAGYTEYYYWNELYDANWSSTGKAGWGTGAGQVAERDVNPGDAFWFDSKSAKSLTIAGTVKKTDHTIASTTGLNLVASAYPVDLNPNTDLIFDGVSAGDQIMVYSKGAGYTEYYYWNELYDANWSSTGKAGWGTGAGQVAEITLPANKAFWIRSAKPFTHTLTSPIK